MCTLVNSGDPDEMQHMAIHLSLHCLLRQKQSSDKEIQFNLKIIPCECEPSIYTRDHPKFIQ